VKKQSFWKRPQAVLLSVALALGAGGIGLASVSRLESLHSPLVLKLASADEGPSRTGFAPVVKKVLPAVVSNSSGSSALSGVSIENLDADSAHDLGLKPNTQGVVVTDVSPSSEAASAGLHKGDVIQEVNHQSVKNTSDFERAVKSSKEEPLLLVNRNGNTMYLAV
jgi:S1-C subfamily serine protease